MKIILPRKRNFGGENVTVSIRLPQELVDALKRLAEERGLGFSEIVADLLDQAAHQVDSKPLKTKRR